MLIVRHWRGYSGHIQFQCQCGDGENQEIPTGLNMTAEFPEIFIDQLKVHKYGYMILRHGYKLIVSWYCPNLQ